MKYNSNHNYSFTQSAIPTLCEHISHAEEHAEEIAEFINSYFIGGWYNSCQLRWKSETLYTCPLVVYEFNDEQKNAFVEYLRTLGVTVSESVHSDGDTGYQAQTDYYLAVNCSKYELLKKIYPQIDPLPPTSFEGMVRFGSAHKAATATTVATATLAAVLGGLELLIKLDEPKVIFAYIAISLTIIAAAAKGADMMVKKCHPIR